MAEVVLEATPSPALPTRGRVPSGICGAIEQDSPGYTLPFMGRVGEGPRRTPTLAVEP
jgi:hypothetical protein